jgi:hypothetical protein
MMLEKMVRLISLNLLSCDYRRDTPPVLVESLFVEEPSLRAASIARGVVLRVRLTNDITLVAKRWLQGRKMLPAASAIWYYLVMMLSPVVILQAVRG